MVQQKKRYENIDFMKGVCILLVVANHVDSLDFSIFSHSSFSLFRMPLYYLLSGIFFSRYDGIRTFLIKKTNNLIIPYIFFSMFTVFTILVFYLRNDYSLQEAYIASKPLHNVPIWFLVSLYEVGILIFIISCIKWQGLQAVFVIIISLFGYYLCMIGIDLPFYLNTALCGIVFYYIGMLLRSRKVLDNSSHILVKFFISLSVFLWIAFWILPDKRLDLFINNIPFAYHWFVFAGLSGTLALFYLSKILVDVPVINYLGKYSIIVLGVHWYFVKSWKYVFFSPTDIIPRSLFLFLIYFFAILMSLVCIVVMKKYLPWFTAQKPLIKI